MAKNPSQKQNFLQGAALLTFAVAIVKIIGAIYKIPLQRILGDVGFSYFNTAYNIYTLLLTIATAGLPVAMSRMISQAYSLGHFNRVRQIYKVARSLYLALGLVCTLVMAIFCQSLADSMKESGAWITILCLSPCALLMGFLSSYRGFFQGQGNMAPTSVSQVLEAACKLVVGLAAAYALKAATESVSWAAAGAIIGVTVSCLISAFYLNRRFRPAYAGLEVSTEDVLSFQRTSGKLLAIAIPITIGSAGLQLLNVVEISVYKGNIQHLFETGQYQNQLVPVLTEEVQQLKDYSPDRLYELMSSSVKGIYDFCYTVFNMPCSLIIPINTSVLPAITAYLTLNDHKNVRVTEESAARVTGLLAAPCAIGLGVLSYPVMGLLGKYGAEKMALAGPMMTVMGLSVFLYALVMFTNVLLQAHGKVHLPVINTLVCGGAKLLAMYFLTANPNIGILGVPILSLLCYLGIAVLNIFCLRRYVAQKPKLVSNLLRSLIPAAVMGGAVYACYWVMENIAHITSNVLLCAGPILVGVIVYIVLVVWTKAITREDCLLLPKGEKIAKFLKL